MKKIFFFLTLDKKYIFQKLFPKIYRKIIYYLKNGNDPQVYMHMQKNLYKVLSKRDIKKFCVGSFDEHQKYDYESKLLKHFSGKSEKALDYGCGSGRMIKKFSKYFSQVDGVDIVKNNLEYAKNYCKDLINSPKFYLCSGIDLNPINDKIYDFIYSTIVIQHIAPHSVRFAILKEIYRCLNEKGFLAFQMTYTNDIKKHFKYMKDARKFKPLTGVADWRDDAVWATTGNSKYDCIVDSKSINHLIEDLNSIGFKDVKYEIAELPHVGPVTDNFIFISAKK